MKSSARWGLLGLGFLAVGVIAYQAGSGGLWLLPAGAQSPAAWKTHEDPMGFSVLVPPGWSVRGDRASGRVEIESAAGESVVVWPVFLPAAGDQTETHENPASHPATAGALNSATASAVARRLAAKLWPDAEWAAQENAGATTIRLLGRRSERTAVSAFTWVSSPKGTAGYFYAATAPTARYRSLADTFAKILSSFRAVGAPSQQQPEAAVRYVRWTDPRENAFSLEVPVGWRISGGSARFASVDVRYSVEAVSLDGEIRVTLGDAEIPMFTEPNQMLAVAGLSEGRWYSPGYGVQMMVRRYTPGTAFAAEYVRGKVAQQCRNLQLTDVRERPDAVQAINAIYSQYATTGIAVHVTAGEAAFTCRAGAQTVRGYYFAGTQSTQSPGVSLWNVQYLFGELAPADKAAQAQAVLERMVGTFELNPQWVSMQQGITANTSQIVSRTQREISGIISKTYWNRQATLDEISRRRSNATLGLVDVVETETGQQFKVESGSNYYWIDHQGAIVGTNTDTRPNYNFRKLLDLP